VDKINKIIWKRKKICQRYFRTDIPSQLKSRLELFRITFWILWKFCGDKA